MTTNEGYKPLRDAKGRLLPGQKPLNATGLAPKQLRMLRNLEGLTPKAIATLERLLDDPNPSAALGAAKEVLDRNLGKVKQQVQVDVTSTHVLHLEALQHLAEKKKQQIIDAQATEIAGNATLYIEGLRGNDVTDADLVAPDNASEAGTPPATPEGRGAAADAPTPPATGQKS
jgi:hypothetical protein